jgi:AIR synthase-related protein
VSAADLVAALRASAGFSHKRDIQAAHRALRDGPHAPCANGDDCAALPDADGFLLFAIEGMLESFVAAEPWFAGYCSVMVNVSDIYAMGGRPTAVVDALWSAEPAFAADVWAGMHAAARAYGVPVVGGHTNTRSAQHALAVAIVGRATRLLTSFDAQPGDVLLAAIDLRGAYVQSYNYWNASTTAPPERLRADLDVLPALAEDGLCRAAKDISMGGLAGTLLMLAECSHVGAELALDAVPAPPDVPLERWLLTFPSYGFVLSVAPDDVERVRARFAARAIACAPIGVVTAGRSVTVRIGADSALLWDFEREAFTGARGVARGTAVA